MNLAVLPVLKDKSPLVGGAVRPWHVVFVVFVSLAVSDVASFYLTRGEEASFRPMARELVRYLLSSSIILAYVLVVPEFRRVLPALFAWRLGGRDATPLAIAFLAMLCWGYGVYRFAVCLPAVLAEPRAFAWLNFYERLADFEPRQLLFLAGMVVVAPAAEELLFRGYLMNLWIARWGIWAGVLLSSLVFGLFHLERTVFAGVLGFILALVYLKYDSLWPGIVLHAAYNLLAFPWLLGGIFYVKHKATITELASWRIEIVLSIAFIPLVIAFWRRFAPARD